LAFAVYLATSHKKRLRDWQQHLNFEMLAPLWRGLLLLLQSRFFSHIVVSTLEVKEQAADEAGT
jgi:hypothetical protein